MLELNGKTILLTGASKGIGAAIARRIGEAGAHVVAHYGNDRDGALEATSAVSPDHIKLIRADLAKLQDVDRLWQAALDWRGRIDAVVNNAAVMRLSGGIDDDDETWDTIWDEALKVNVLSPVRLMRNAVRHYRQIGGGILITISSWAAQRGPGNPVLLAYASSKGAILTATKTIARNYAKDNILAYVVAPGVVRTQMSEQAAAAAGGEAAFTASLAMGEWVPPTDIANLVAFLATGQCKHLSGATLDVNGASYIR